jgi:hypothetical protein
LIRFLLSVFSENSNTSSSVGDTEKIIEGMDVGKADGKREAMIVGS